MDTAAENTCVINYEYRLPSPALELQTDRAMAPARSGIAGFDTRCGGTPSWR